MDGASALIRRAAGVRGRGVWFVREVFGQLSLAEGLVPFDELDHRALGCGAALARAGVRRGQRLAFIVPTPEQAVPLFFGALRAGIAVVPIDPPLTAGELEGFGTRLTQALRETGAAAVVLTDKLVKVLGNAWRPPSGCAVIALDVLRDASAATAFDDVAQDEIAVVPWRPSTGPSAPLALVTHGELLTQVADLAREIAATDDDVFVSWLPPFRDAGLMALLLPFFCRASLALLPTMTFLKRPASWLEAIARVRGTISFAPEDGYAFCAAKLGEREVDALELSSWRLAGAATSPVSADTAAAFATKFARAGFDRAALARARRPLPAFGADAGAELSYGQQALWFIAQLAPHSVAYNVSMCLRIRSEYDRYALRSALQVLYRRHPALRTVFDTRGGVPRRQRLGPETLEFVTIDARHADENEFERRMIAEVDRPFDLAIGPLFGARLFERGQGDAALLLVAHHIIVDMLSFVVLVGELAELYGAFTRDAAASVAADGTEDASFDEFVRWQRALIAGPRGERLRRYWAEQLAGAPHVLALPTDRPRPALQTYRGASIALRLDDALAAALRALAREHQTTTYTVLLGVFQALLHHHTGQVDLLVASPVSGRGNAAFAGSVGYFVNTVPLRGRIDAATTFGALLDQLRITVLSALDHQDLPFSSIVEQAQVARELNRSPLCQVIFALQNPPAGDNTSELMRAAVAGGQARLGGLRVEIVDLPRRIAQFDLRLNLLDAGGGISGFLEYNADLFQACTAERLAADFIDLAERLVREPARPIAAQRLGSPACPGASSAGTSARPAHTPEAERAQIARWNATEVAFPNGCVPHAIEQQARRTPHARALEFESDSRTYDELNRDANRIARALRALGAGQDVLVGVAMERSLELPLALLAVLKAGAAYVPLDPSLPAERLRTMSNDARPRIVIADDAQRAAFLECGAHVVDSAELSRIGRDPEADGADLELAIEPGALAYVIYTSGSTGTPKGVANTHAGLWNRLCWMQQYFAIGERDCVLQKTPYSFDVSVWEFFWPLMTGARLVVARPQGHKDSRYLLDEIARRGVTTIHFVPSMLEAFVFEPELGAAGVSPLARVICSGEALPYALMLRCFERLPGVELYNLYGPTEASIDVTVQRCTPHPRGIVPIGRPIANTQIHILDVDMRPVPIGSQGELYIGGVQLARGYLGRPELTAERFVPDPSSSKPGARLYRTGDLARFDESGLIEYLGRNDDQIKLRGFRIELGEIEAVAQRHPAVARCVVLPRRNAFGGTQLHGILVPAPGAPLDPAQVAELLRGTLPEHMVPGEFSERQALPLTHSGKVDRKALLAELEAAAPARSADGAPTTERERVLVDIWRQVLGVSEISVHDNYFALGGDSIRSLQLRALARARGLRLEVPALFEHQTIAELARALPEQAPTTPERRLAPFALVGAGLRAALAEYEDAFPATQLQLGMLFHSELTRDSWAYHDIFGFELELRDEFSESALRDALCEVMRRHPVLRSCFDLGGYERPVQLVRREVPAPLEVLDLRARPEADARSAIAAHIRVEKSTGYRLTAAPLFRLMAHVLPQRHVHLTLSFHHAILDGWSTASLLRELLTEYVRRNGGTGLSELPAPRHVFAEFVALEAEAIASEASRAYFRQQLQDSEFTRIARRADAPCAAHAGSGRVIVEIARELSLQLANVAKQRGVALKVLLLCAHARVIAAYSGQDDIVTGRVVHGRPEVADAERIVGLFLNTLPTRLTLAGKTWAALARDVVDDEQRAHAHRRFPLREIQRLLGRTALFETAFNFVNYHVYDALLDDGALRVANFEAHENTAFALLASFVASPRDGRLALHLEHDAQQIAPDHAQQIARGYVRALAALAADVDAPIEDACVLDPEQRARLLERWNDTGPAAPAEAVHALIERQVARSPNAIAVRSEGRGLTYAELDQQACTLAQRLRQRGAKPRDVIAICAEPSIERAVAVLSVLKAGCAYLPLDPSYPRSRLEFMLEHARARIVLASPAHADAQFLAGSVRLVLDDTGASTGAASPVPLTAVGAQDPAYVIYTSGSTGQPKGIVMQHAPLTNLIAWQIAHSALSLGAASAQFSAFSFDVSFQETFATWACGGTLVIVPERCRRDARALARLLQGERVARLFVPVVILHQLAEVGEQLALELPDLREINTAGEQLEITPAVRAFFRRHARCRLANHYGPSETHVATAHALPPEPERWPFAPPIGRPLPGVRAYVLDRARKLLPPGVPGELYLGGACVSLGYCGDEALSAERFVADPFAVPGGRMYRTGDVARHLPDGALEYLGRRDGQVKIRGYRVELGEVEQALVTIDPQRIRRAAVVTVPSRSPASRHELAAYVVFDRGPQGAPLDSAALRTALSRRLPAHMLPSTICELPQLPLTPSGKLDRLALARLATDAQRLERPSVIAPPDNQLEAELCVLWREVLGCCELGVTDDFFERGGDSLSAVRLMARVQRRYGLELPISALVEAPSVRGLAQVIEDAGAGARAHASALVRLHGSDSLAPRPPLFCVHPIGGNVLCYMPLARQLGREQPVYGLQAHGLATGGRPCSSIPQMASAYAQEMLALQPSGRMHVAGWSFGGIVAVEIARQLEAAGRELAPVVVMDTMASIRFAVEPSDTDVLEGFALELFGAALEGDAWEEILSPASGLAQQERVARLIARARADGLVPDGVGHEQLERVFSVMRASLSAFNAYEQRWFGGELILLRCLDPMPGRLRRMHDLIGSSYEDRTNGWGHYCAKVTVVPVQGDHLTIVREPHVAQVARIMRRVLDGRDVDATAGSAPAHGPIHEGMG